jgi:LysM repeat protein
MPSGALKRLNPQLIRGVTPPNDTYSVVVPIESQDRFLAALQTTKQESARHFLALSGSGTKKYTVRRGDSLTTIAKKYSVSVDDLAKANRLKASSSLYAGKQLVIPQSTDPVLPPDTAAREDLGKPSRTKLEGDPSYTIKSGDTLLNIAQKQGITLAELRGLNNLDEHGRIYVGDKLRVRSNGNGGTPAHADAKRVHTVARGEFPASIASKYGVDVDNLMRWNNLTSKSVLRIGDKLVLDTKGEGDASASSEGDIAPAASAGDVVKEESITFTPAPPAPKKESYKVAKSDTLGSIASKYNVSVGDLRKWNKLNSKSLLHPGENLVVFTQPGAKSASSEMPKAAEKKTYTVTKGDAPGSIAAKLGVKLDDLLESNKLTRKSTIHIGDKLAVPGPGEAPAIKTASVKTESKPESKPEKQEQPAESAPTPANEKRTYVVAKGDTLGTIASKSGVSLDDLMKWNDLTRTSTIRVDDDLVLYAPAAEPDTKEKAPKQVASVPKEEKPAAAAPVSAAETKVKAPGERHTHRVAKGDSPSTIAAKYGVKTSDLLKWNGLTSSSVLQIGQELAVSPENGGKTSSKSSAPKPSKETASKSTTHTVGKGENPTGIAKKYGVKVSDLYTWNAWSKDHVLHAGDTVKIEKK